MKDIKTKIFCSFAALLIMFGAAVSCSEADEHYGASDEVKGRVSLWEMISQNPELSVFASMLQHYSYDKLLSGDQTYTVWAPANEFLGGISIDDSLTVARIITSHIARYSYPASEKTSENSDIYMLNAKKQAFTHSGAAYLMGGVELQSANMAANNGILHILNGKIPFFPNIWQTMEESRFDSIRNYLYSFNKREFLRSASQQIDINEEGMIVYDSVFSVQNTMWYVYNGAKGIGWLNNEDSLYTMVLPDNNAWRETYEKYYPLFLPDPSLEQQDSMQAANTRYAIVQDLVFRGEIANPGIFSTNDSLISTRGAVIHNPAHIFGGNEAVHTSNGWVYPTSNLQYDMTDSYVKHIKIEAEIYSGRLHDESRDMSTISNQWETSIPGISNNGYLFVRNLGKSSSETPTISFEIPGVLHTEYDIYAVFLSPSFVKPASQDTSVTRVKFEIQQWNRLGPKSDDRFWGNGKNWGPGYTLASFSGTGPEWVTEKRGITVIKAAERYVFPFANVNETDNVFRIRVISAPSRTDTNSKDNKFNKEMRIDYLLLVPSPSN
ncbi:MAG: fasciclin domain-containing protein [Dysgonamonadaceae bacterium]|jgi:uncharacterized surface protein with fasciclin (FAS1) repeats|nr:fasciclin domain-containing protein [Dysgonamonadaceae bacterium]